MVAYGDTLHPCWQHSHEHKGGMSSAMQGNWRQLCSLMVIQDYTSWLKGSELMALQRFD